MAVASSAQGDWTFGGAWPYEPRWLTTPDGIRIHYVDEGPRGGQTVVMLHGNPTWGYLYRNFIRALTDRGFRAIAHDEMGFGRSEKPADVRAYSVERHVRHFGALVDELRLDQVTLVVHDWGGPIGLSWAVDHPERVARLAILNTVAWPAPTRRPSLAYRILASPGLGDLLVRRANVVVRYALPRRLVARPIPESERRGYLECYPTPASRTGIYAAVRLAVESVEGGPAREHLARLEAALDRLAGKPTLIVWGMRDPILKPALLRRFRERFPQAEVHELADASHFLQEDAPERILPLLLKYLERS
jgi:haloalkane dehalogenase